MKKVDAELCKKNFSTDTPAGTKICLLGTLPLESGLVLINAANCRVLGGTVERLVEKWKLEKVGGRCVVYSLGG